MHLLLCCWDSGLPFSARLRIAHAHDDALRVIAELLAKEVEAADVLGVLIHADAQGNVVPARQAQIGQTDAGERFAVERGAGGVHDPYSSLDESKIYHDGSDRVCDGYSYDLYFGDSCGK